VAESASGGDDPRGPLGADLKRMLVAVTIFTLGNSTDAFLLLRFSDLGVGAGWLAVLWAAHNLVRMASTWVGGRWSDRVGRKPLMVAGWGLYGLVYLGFGATTALGPLLVLFLVYGLYFGLTEPVKRAWVASLALPAAVVPPSAGTTGQSGSPPSPLRCCSGSPTPRSAQPSPSEPAQPSPPPGSSFWFEYPTADHCRRHRRSDVTWAANGVQWNRAERRRPCRTVTAAPVAMATVIAATGPIGTSRNMVRTRFHTSQLTMNTTRPAPTAVAQAATRSARASLSLRIVVMRTPGRPAGT